MAFGQSLCSRDVTPQMSSARPWSPWARTCLFDAANDWKQPTWPSVKDRLSNLWDGSTAKHKVAERTRWTPISPLRDSQHARDGGVGCHVSSKWEAQRKQEASKLAGAKGGCEADSVSWYSFLQFYMFKNFQVFNNFSLQRKKQWKGGFCLYSKLQLQKPSNPAHFWQRKPGAEVGGRPVVRI